MDTVHVIGVPLDLGAENPDVRLGPDAYREHDVLAKLQKTGLHVIDDGNVPVRPRADVPVGNPKMRRAEEVVRVCEETAKLTEAAMHSGQGAVVLGGDHSICLGAVSGASVGLGGRLGLIYFDAHGDMNTDETTPTGNTHGMQLAALLGVGAPELTHVHGEQVKIRPENLLHIGGSDFDAAELDLIKQENLQAFTLFDLLTKGMGALIPLIDDLASRVDHLWVSLDLDAIDVQYAPAAGMPNAKGLLYREIALLAEYVGQTKKVVGVDVVEYNPLQDEDNGKTAELAVELIAAFFNKRYNWYAQYLERNKL
jgi:arginase